jgi:hypothetical protein
MKPIVTSAVLFLLAVPTLSGRAQAREATQSGLSVAVGLEQTLDGSVANASDAEGAAHRAGHLDANALGNVGDFAFGAAVAWVPDIFGDGRLVVGGRGGWQPTVGGTRFQVLGDGGLHRFTAVGGSFFSTSTPNVVDTPYVGLEVGMTRTFVRGGHLEGGVSLFVRQDLETQTVLHQESGGFGFFGGGDTPPPPPTELRVGGTMMGALLTLGFRVEKHRPTGL